MTTKDKTTDNGIRHRICAITLIMAMAAIMPYVASAMEPVKWNQRYQNYIDKYSDLAVYQMLKHNIPASITMAQGLLESAAGESTLARKGNNHFGIKCHDWTGPSMKKDDDAIGECFRVYKSPYDSYEDHSKVLERPRYRRLFSLRRTDYAGWARGLKACGYATNPRYADLLIDIIRCYNLHALDNAKTYDIAKVRGTGGNIDEVPRKFVAHNTTTTEHVVRMNNHNYYVFARKGDTFRTIGKEFGLSYRKLAKINERDKQTVLDDWDIVYLEKKRTKADKEFKNRPHIVCEGESMYTIAQKYGIRLKSLYKKNRMSPDYQLRVGDRIRVY